jgi:hypothetical protein
MLQRNAEEQEILSRDRRDRRDYDQIANLAKRMGLFRFLCYHFSVSGHQLFTSLLELFSLYVMNVVLWC